MSVIKVDGDKITLKGDSGIYEVTRDMGDKDVLVGNRVIVTFNNGRLWFWVFWTGNRVPLGESSVFLPNKFSGEIYGYFENKCLIKVDGKFYWIPAWCRVPTGQYNIKVVCRYIKTMKVARWKIDSTVSSVA